MVSRTPDGRVLHVLTFFPLGQCTVLRRKKGTHSLLLVWGEGSAVFDFPFIPGCGLPVSAAFVYCLLGAGRPAL